MDEVLEQLESTIITKGPTDEEKSDYQTLYKNWGRLGNQEERRKEILELQKTHRNDKIDAFRGILELVKVVEDNNIFQPYNKVHYRPRIYVAGFNKASVNYNNVLMLSEWMIEKPTNFSEDWLVVPCPKGGRMLVVAHKGKTRTYSKYGHFKLEFQSALPGGSSWKFQKNRCCVLDCFYVPYKKIMYILDILAWNNQPMTDGEMEFRQYWLKSQLMELPDLATRSKNNQIIFQLLPAVPCTPDIFNSFMMTYPHFEDNNATLDGFLFYHKRAHYVSGETPLVGWLFPYMVPEVLGSEITIHPEYMSAKPPDYVSQAQFIQAFEEKMAKKRHRGSRPNSDMDTSGSTEADPNENPVQEPTENVAKAAEKMEADDKAESIKDNEPENTEQMEEKDETETGKEDVEHDSNSANVKKVDD